MIIDKLDACDVRIPSYLKSTAEMLFSIFPSFERDVKTADIFHGVYPMDINIEDCQSINPFEYEYEKLCTAIHEAGHLVAILMSDSWDKHLLETKIECDWSKENNVIAYGWHGHVLFNEGMFNDDVISSILNSAGINAALSLGIPSSDAWNGSNSDMKFESKNMLKNTKRIGGIEKTASWTKQKHEYKRFMKQEADTFFLYSRAIMDENKRVITALAAQLYEKESIPVKEVGDIVSKYILNKESYNALIRYVKAFYK